MSKNLELLRTLQEEWNRGEESSWVALFHPEVEFVPQRSGTEGAYRGLTGIEAFVADTREVFETFEVHYEYAQLGDRVLAWGKIHIRARGSGVEMDMESGGLFEFRDGKIARWQDYGSKTEALKAAGEGA